MTAITDIVGTLDLDSWQQVIPAAPLVMENGHYFGFNSDETSCGRASTIQYNLSSKASASLWQVILEGEMFLLKTVEARMVHFNQKMK